METPDLIYRTYIPIAVLLGIGICLAGLRVTLSLALGPRRPSERERTPHESGLAPIGEAERELPVRCYLVAVLFILFDIEIIFLLPWAVTFRQRGLFGLAEVLVFMAILIVGYYRVWKKG